MVATSNRKKTKLIKGDKYHLPKLVIESDVSPGDMLIEDPTTIWPVDGAIHQDVLLVLSFATRNDDFWRPWRAGPALRCWSIIQNCEIIIGKADFGYFYVSKANQL